MLRNMVSAVGACYPALFFDSCGQWYHVFPGAEPARGWIREVLNVTSWRAVASCQAIWWKALDTTIPEDRWSSATVSQGNRPFLSRPAVTLPG